ncbi:Na+/H+ antiporter subunit E [Clostridium sediminicola]|uniref:Na+/H+ antiporter subunit E n=1 Tax=Clostridium sediminicola TaxID=3114879 RepID=UPI0031F24586
MTYLLILLYSLFWLILSQRLTIEVIFLGLLIGILVFWFNKELINNENIPVLKTFKKIKILSLYILVLLKEIVIANIEVAAIVLNPKSKINPCITTYETKLSNEFWRTILANSITLTPGTLTVSMVGNKLTIHCLKQEYVSGIIDSKFEKILLKVEEVK